MLYKLYVVSVYRPPGWNGPHSRIRGLKVPFIAILFKVCSTPALGELAASDRGSEATAPRPLPSRAVPSHQCNNLTRSVRVHTGVGYCTVLA